MAAVCCKTNPPGRNWAGPRAPTVPNNEALTVPNRTVYLLPPENAWWACSSGLAACHPLRNPPLPEGRLLHPCPIDPQAPVSNGGTRYITGLALPIPEARESLLPPWGMATLLGPGLVGAGTGTSSLVIQDKNYRTLRAALDLAI